MTPEAQRIAIAEACGIIKQPNAWTGVKTSTAEFVVIPDYLNDLNAMHEAERGLSDYDHCTFRQQLFVGVYNRGEGQTNQTAERGSVSATASQRAEAFLRTLGLWKDEP